MSIPVLLPRVESTSNMKGADLAIWRPHRGLILCILYNIFEEMPLKLAVNLHNTYNVPVRLLAATHSNKLRECSS